MSDFSPEEVQKMLDNLDNFSDEEVTEIEKMVDELDARQKNQVAYDDLIEFCRRMMPDFIVGKHHRILADMLMESLQNMQQQMNSEQKKEGDKSCDNPNKSGQGKQGKPKPGTPGNTPRGPSAASDASAGEAVTASRAASAPIRRAERASMEESTRRRECGGAPGWTPRARDHVRT